ncbi:hypothetical protein EON79_17050 [bacterium]|nr:MAG: hypothetical protein EON79_17050 [bacterium]
MPILAAISYAQRPPVLAPVRPLVAHRLTPPNDPETGRPFDLQPNASRPGKPVDTEGGLIWTTPARAWTLKGVIAFTIPNGQGVWANLSRRWWSYGTDAGAGLLDAVTGTTRVYPGVQGPVDDSGIDDHGVPVSLRDVDGAVYGRPAHGGTLLKLPPGFVDSPRMYSDVLAASSGPILAGALTMGDAESPRVLPFVWADDRAEPKALSMPEGYTQTIVSALNSRGDVAGLVSGPDLPNQTLIWRADGTVTRVPVGLWDTRRPAKVNPYSASEPNLLTEDGLLIGSETSKSAPWGFITTYWDGQRALWLPNAIEGVHALRFESMRLTNDGRGLLTRIWDGKAWGWYRVSPR